MKKRSRGDDDWIVSYSNSEGYVGKINGKVINLNMVLFRKNSVEKYAVARHEIIDTLEKHGVTGTEDILRNAENTIRMNNQQIYFPLEVATGLLKQNIPPDPFFSDVARIGKFVVVFDLDGTLVSNSRSATNNSIPVTFNNQTLYYQKRPNASSLLQFVQDHQGVQKLIIATKSWGALARLVVEKVLDLIVGGKLEIYGLEYFGKTAKKLCHINIVAENYDKVIVVEDNDTEFRDCNCSKIIVNSFSGTSRDQELSTVRATLTDYLNW